MDIPRQVTASGVTTLLVSIRLSLRFVSCVFWFKNLIVSFTFSFFYNFLACHSPIG